MRIGIIGIGVVGREVINILEEQGQKIEKLFSEKVEVVKICNRSPKEGLDSYEMTHDYKVLLEDNSIDTIIELVGGIEIPYDIAKKTLEAGKNFITANKYLLAIHGKELFVLATENNSKLFYEAAVGGGIPVLSPLKEGLFPNEITRVRGILNGTSNYILTEMDGGATFSEALEGATIKGYAEADPTFDIEGIDTAHKISLLSYLAFGKFIDFNEIEIEGITKLTIEDIKNAKEQEAKYKLIGEAKLEGDKISLSVKPTLISSSELLYGVDGVYNAVEIDGTYTGKTILYGEGAGGSATASAVISDLYKVIASKNWN